MTFLELYSTFLDIELASSDTVQLFTTVRRKAAVNAAQGVFVRMTGCTKVYGSVALTDSTGEYDLEVVLFPSITMVPDYVRMAGPPSVKITTTATGAVRWIQGDQDFPRRDPEELDREEPGWRNVSDGTPISWYLRDDGGSTYIGLHPEPKIPSTETWVLVVPYVALAPDMTTPIELPFTINAGPIKRLIPYHQALVHYAAALLEPLRKNYSGAQHQMALYTSIVAQYFQQLREDGPDQITFKRDYRGEASRKRNAIMNTGDWHTTP